jgi:cell fate regulator YaaT (PSP1 superfamily)
VFDWLGNLQMVESEPGFAWVEVRFKSTRKEFFYNSEKLPLQQGTLVAVEGSPGHDIGTVSLTGELVKAQMRKTRFDPEQEALRKIFRIAREADVERWQEAIKKEDEFMRHARKVALDLRLSMKISDVECQGDGSKATFYYTADGRVDFRELIKILARDLRVRIEMRQIGYRQEAGRLGGIGVCGRELCCSTWLKDFRSVTTAAARYQQLSINPQKLAGQCGKLKCCLNYELDTYLDALKGFPSPQLKLKTAEGTAVHQKTDIFKGIVYYSYLDRPEILIPLSLDAIEEVAQQNKQGIVPGSLADFKVEVKINEPLDQDSFTNVIEEGSLDRFDRKKRNSGQRRRPNSQGRNRNQRKSKPQSNAPKS